MSQQRIYLDATAGQPWSVSADVLPVSAAMGWTLGSGVHSEAAKARALVEASLATLADLWGVSASAIIPVHNLANAFALAAESLQGEVVFSPMCRLGAIKATQSASASAKPLEVDASGYLTNIDAIRADWCVVQAGNHEVGSIDALELLKSASGGRLLVDASEWFGHMPGLPTGDVIVARASAWAGPLSACFVVYPNGAPALTAQRRQALAPDAVLVATAAAAFERGRDTSLRVGPQSEMLKRLAQNLGEISGVEVHGDFSRPRLPHVLSFSVQHLDAETLARSLDVKGFAVGAGSACLGENGEPSHVLKAMGVDTDGNIRVSLPLSVDASDLAQFADCVRSLIDEARASHAGS